MGKTAAERQRECRKRKKNAGLHEEMKKKDREQKAIKKASMNHLQLNKLR